MVAKLIAVNITLGPSAAKARRATLARLKTAGLRNVVMLEAIGVVTGEIPEPKLKALSKFDGITVERNEVVDIQPPDAPVQ